MDRFQVGQTIVKRDVFRGRVSTAWPRRIVADNGKLLIFAMWPGTKGFVPTSWIEQLSGDRPEARREVLSGLASGKWQLGEWVWQDSDMLTYFQAGWFYSVDLFFDTEGRFLYWYVNFQRPFRRTLIGIDTFDLLLDLVVKPDLTFRWKDEEEYSEGRRLGIISDEDHMGVEQARFEVLHMIAHREPPFVDEWRSWQRDPSWPTLAVSESVLE
jgi:protein associated with RNAse G/E